MGCVSSKHVKKEMKREITVNNGGDHVVCLKSSTYGVLKLDKDEVEHQREEDGAPEVINAWELMEDLDEDGFIKRSPKSRVFVREKSVTSPLKFLNQMASPLKLKKHGIGGKENKGSPKTKLGLNSCNAALKFSYPVKSTRNEGLEGGHLGFSSRRRVFSPLFDPELIALYEEEEQIKMIISPQPETRKSEKSLDSKAFLQDFESKCPAGGEKAVVVYTTTLRGVRKTFEECNRVRSIIKAYHIQVSERDVSMDSGFKEELRKLTGTKEVRVPLVFVKGRLIGGVEEIVELEEEGKLEMLFEGIPMAVPGCKGCGGVRFVMCKQCNGSCKLLGKDLKKIRCSDCNENGLIRCPICC